MSRPIGYVATGYPYPSHTFIRNEVEALRRGGALVETFTPLRSDPSSVLSPADRDALETTFAIRPFRWPVWLRAHSRALLTGAWMRGLRAAWRARGSDWRSPVWQVFYFGQAIVLWWAARRRGVRHLHAHFANNGADIAMLAAAAGGRGWSWSFTMHGPTEFRDEQRFRLDKKAADARLVVCISDFARSQLMTLTDPAAWDKLVIVHCGVRVGALPPPEPPRAGAPLRIVCVGRLVPEKGQTLLVEAVAQLRRRGHPVELELIGDGPSRTALTELARRLGAPVSVAGARAHDEALRAVAAADVFCLPSFAEGVPVSLMEAMALGKPAVSTRIMGIPELIHDGATGVLVAPGNLEALTEALERLVREPELRARLGRAGADHVRSHYDADVEAGRLRRLFEATGVL